MTLLNKLTKEIVKDKAWFWNEVKVRANNSYQEVAKVQTDNKALILLIQTEAIETVRRAIKSLAVDAKWSKTKLDRFMANKVNKRLSNDIALDIIDLNRE